MIGDLVGSNLAQIWWVLQMAALSLEKDFEGVFVQQKKKGIDVMFLLQRGYFKLF